MSEFVKTAYNEYERAFILVTQNQEEKSSKNEEAAKDSPKRLYPKRATISNDVVKRESIIENFRSQLPSAISKSKLIRHYQIREKITSLLV